MGIRAPTLVGCLLLLVHCGNHKRSAATSATEANVNALVNLRTFQMASVVIGQADFNQNLPNRGASANSATIAAPFGNSAAYNNKLLLPDTGNNRYLVYNQGPITNGAGADSTIGQGDFVSTGAGSGAAGLSTPQSAFFADGQFFATDNLNSRILVWPTFPSGLASASIAIGWPSVTSAASGCSASTLSTPENSLVVGQKLVVGDSGNNRVLIWNSIPTISGTSPDLVLGQPNLTTCIAVAPTSVSLAYPSGVWSDGTRLVVPDYANHRVLIWLSFPTVNQQPADLVLGQPSFTTNTAVTPPTNQDMNGPYFATSNGTQLFVAEAGNNRVIVWNKFPSASATAADVVLGQSDFAHKAANDDNQDGTSDTQPTARTFNLPSGLLLFNRQLIVSDAFNNRFLIFKSN